MATPNDDTTVTKEEFREMKKQYAEQIRSDARTDEIGGGGQAAIGSGGSHGSRFARGTDNNTKNKGTLTKMRRHQVAQEEMWEDAARGDVGGLTTADDFVLLILNALRTETTGLKLQIADRRVSCRLSIALHP